MRTVRNGSTITGTITDNGNELVARTSDGHVAATYNKQANNTRVNGQVIGSGDQLEEILSS